MDEFKHEFRGKLHEDGEECIIYATAARLTVSIFGPSIEFYNYVVVDQAATRILDHGAFTTPPVGCVHADDRREVGEVSE